MDDEKTIKMKSNSYLLLLLLLLFHLRFLIEH